MNFNFYNSFVKFSVYISSISLKISRFISYRFLYNENTKFIKFHENRNNCYCIYTPTNEHTYQHNQYDSSICKISNISQTLQRVRIQTGNWVIELELISPQNIEHGLPRISETKYPAMYHIFTDPLLFSFIFFHPLPSPSNCRRVRIPFGFWEGPFRGRRSRISIHAPQTAAEYTHFRQ